MDNDDTFSKKLQEAKGNLSQSAKESSEWFKKELTEAEKQRKSDPNRIFTKAATVPQIGQMYLYVYDPKYKDVLPFYDAHPLVFPIEFSKEGFLGINLHYLPPVARARLMDSLKSIANNNKYNQSTKLNISYEVLRSYATRFKGFESCIKRYLFAHVRTAFHMVSADQWDKAVMLPLQSWKVNSNKKYAGSPPY